MVTERRLAALIDLYLLRCDVEGKSPRTVCAYRETLGRFLRSVPVNYAAAVTTEHLYAYLGRFTSLSPETRHRYFREVRCFFNWLVAAGYLGRNPFRGMRNVRLPQRIVSPFSPDEVTALLVASGAGQMGARDRALILTLLDTGARCSEVVQLELADLDLDAGRLHILRAKGGKQRVVPFAARCRDALDSYLALRGDVPGPLFLASNGHGQLADPSFTMHVKESAQADVPASARPIVDRDERRTFFAEFLGKLDRGGEIEEWMAGSPLVEVTLESISCPSRSIAR